MRRAENQEGVLMPAVAYYRMSTDRQDKSIAEQAEAVAQLASTKGYRIIRDYRDEGISGDATEKRLSFQQMIADASERRDFVAILAWDQDRIGRFNSMEAGYWLHPLVKAGVHLCTVAQGRVDWDDFTGRLMFQIAQEGKHQFLRDLARNSLRGLIARAKAGKWVGGPPPFGYVLGDDEHLEFGDPAKVETVRNVFRMRVDGMGYRTIANRLNRQSVAAPSGGPWSHDSVRLILCREAYCGTVTLGGRRQGKYFTTNDDQVQAVAATRKQKTTPVRTESAHPAIVDRATFEVAQAMRTSHPKPHWREESEGTPLAGLLRCGRCGGPMYAQSLQRKGGQKFPNYICGTYHKGHGCGYCAVSQAGVLLAVSKTIREGVLKRSKRGLERAVAAEIDRRASARSQREAERVSPKRLADLDRKISNAMDRLVSVDASLVPAIEEKLMELKAERSRLTAASESHDARKAALDPKEVASRIWELDAILRKASPSKVRQALSRLVERIVLDFTPGKSTGRGKRFEFSKGTIVLRPIECTSPASAR